MDAQGQLDVRRNALRAELDRMSKLVTVLEDPTPDQRLRAALKADIGALEEQADRAQTWQQTADAARSVRHLAQRVLELAVGMSARAQRLDDGMCRLADALLRQVSAAGGPPWTMATVPANADFFSERDHVIRLRWPGEGIWTLPLALHELGHFVGRRIEVNTQLDDDRWTVLRPFELRLTETGEEVPADWHHLHELFADAYATFVGGPAYLACAVTIGLDPADDACAAKTHPAPSRRVALILDILARMNGCSDNSASLHYDVEPWRNNWTRTVQWVSGTDTTQDDADGELAEFFWAILHDRLRNARYRTMNEAKSLAGTLLANSSRDVTAVRMTDVLNAVWSARQQPDADLTTVEERGRALFENVVDDG